MTTYKFSYYSLQWYTTAHEFELHPRRGTGYMVRVVFARRGSPFTVFLLLLYTRGLRRFRALQRSGDFRSHVNLLIVCAKTGTVQSVSDNLGPEVQGVCILLYYAQYRVLYIILYYT